MAQLPQLVGVFQSLHYLEPALAKERLYPTPLSFLFLVLGATMFFSTWFTLPLLGLSSLVHSFPTAENLAKLNAPPEEIHKVLLELRDKRLLVSTGKPVDGKSNVAF